MLWSIPNQVLLQYQVYGANRMHDCNIIIIIINFSDYYPLF